MLDSISQVLERFFAFLGRELAPSPRRVIEAARNAAKSAVTTGLAATMQIAGPFGPLFAFRIGQPGVSFGLFEGALTIACAAVMQAAIVPITGKLLDYPGLIMAFLFVVFAVLAYFLSNTRLFLILGLVAVGTITTVYVGIFEPGEIGWGSTYTFDGILVAALVMTVFDTLIWPSPPEPRLLESLAADLERTRSRLSLAGQRYLDPLADPLPPLQIKSMLARSLVLLKSIKQQMKPSPQHLADLLDAITTVEHLYLEVEHLAVLANEPVSDQIRQNHREAIEAALLALDREFAVRTEAIRAGLDARAGGVGAIPALHPAVHRLTELSKQSPPASDALVTAELGNFVGFAGGVETISILLESRERGPGLPTAERTEAEADIEPRPLVDPAAFRFSIKLGAAITLGLLVGLTTQRADLQTILWSIAVAGQPNQYGAVLRKTLLRLAGCIVGGLAALAAMIIVSQNFDSLPPYVVIIFAVTMFATYVSQSSEWLAYAGIQVGITFLICYVGLAPASDVYKPLWRFWGIVLGVLTAGFVFLLLWPEYASDKLIEHLGKLMQTTLKFAKEVTDGSVTDGRIAAAEQRVSEEVLGVLSMADQARFEGSRGMANSAAGLEAASTVIRIAYRFEIIARGRLSGAGALMPDNVSQNMAAIEEAIRAALNFAAGNLAPPRLSEQIEPLSEAPLESAIDLKALIDERAAAAMLESGGWTPGLQSFFVKQLESYYRLAVLLGDLDVQIAKLAGF